MQRNVSYTVSVLAFTFVGFLTSIFVFTMDPNHFIVERFYFLLISIPFGVAIRYLLNTKDGILAGSKILGIISLIVIYAFILAYLSATYWDAQVL